MKITNQQELNNLIATADESNTIILNENLEITFYCEIPCNIKAQDIKARNIEARNIQAWDIKAYDITARNINTNNIYARNIDAYDITAGNINAWKIDAHNITADNIKYYALCIAYESLKCESISGTRENSIYECLDQEFKIVKSTNKINK